MAARTIGNYAAYLGRSSIGRDCLTADTRSVLDRMEAKFGKVKLVSTCRAGATIARTGRPSFHRYGKAVDFDAPRGRKFEIVNWLNANEPVFVMTYRDMAHIHFNTGQSGMALAKSSGKRYAKRRYRQATAGGG